MGSFCAPFKDNQYVVPPFFFPHRLRVTSRGTFLISTEVLVYELQFYPDYSCSSDRFRLIPFGEQNGKVTTDCWEDTCIAETQWFKSKNIIMLNHGENSLQWQAWG
jgi:hypothetical protein